SGCHPAQPLRTPTNSEAERQRTGALPLGHRALRTCDTSDSRRARRAGALAREDLVHTDDEGAITVAYPFSAHPRGHEVTLGGRVVQAMCAIDALGIA